MAKKGGRQPGSGRPKGSLNKTTIDSKIALKEIRDRVMRSRGALINSQMAIAHGLTFLYVIKTVGTGKNRKRLKPQIVKDQETIESYLADELTNDDNQYYFMSTQRPDNKALDSLLDRTFGKATQVVAGDPDNPIVHQITGMKVVPEKNGNRVSK